MYKNILFNNKKKMPAICLSLFIISYSKRDIQWDDFIGTIKNVSHENLTLETSKSEPF